MLITRDAFRDKPKQLDTTGVKSFLVPCEVHLSSQWGALTTPLVSPGKAARLPVFLSHEILRTVRALVGREKVPVKNLQASNC